MNWGWVASIDQLWRSPSFPMWLTLAAAGFFGVIVLITLLRAEKSVANGALTVITLLAIGIASAATLRSYGPGGAGGRSAEQLQPVGLAMPALSCIDDLAGETALTACEKALYGSPEAVAAAVSYAAARLTRLTALGDVATANKSMTPDLERLRRAIEHDRYGLHAYVLSARDHCQPGECAAYQSLTDHNQIAANMDERVYEAAVMRYAPSWNAPPAPAAPALATSGPTGKPTNADFPTANSIPPVNIMTPEPPLNAAPAKPPATAAAPVAPKPAASAANAQAPQTAGQARPAAVAAAKKPPAPKPHPVAPTPLAPPEPSADNN